MAVTQRARRKLQEKLEQVLGPDEADTLMEEVGSLRTEQSSLREEMRIGFAEAGRERAELRAELKTDIADLRADLKGDIAALSLDMAKQTRQLGIWILASQASLAGIIFAAVRP